MFIQYTHKLGCHVKEVLLFIVVTQQKSVKLAGWPLC